MELTRDSTASSGAASVGETPTSGRPTSNQPGQPAYHYAPDSLPQHYTPSADMWRYISLLPLDEGEPVGYPLAVGGTPLHAPPRLRHELQLPHLWLKDETRGPTGSNKDRATALVLEIGRRDGAPVVSCASTGNVAISLAVGAASVGMHAVVFVPADIADTKLAPLLLAGATVVRVAAGYSAAFELSRRAAEAFGWLERNTGVNPATVEAKKTVAFEIWEQLHGQVPDTVVVPVGDGPTLCGMAKGFREIMACGRSRRLPRLIAVQAEGCQPLKTAWDLRAPIRPVVPATLADGVAVGEPIIGPQVLRDVAESSGTFVAVSDEDMLDAVRVLASSAGIVAEPAGALALAGLRAAQHAGLVQARERVVVEITGSGFKTPGHLRSSRSPIDHKGSNLDRLASALPRAVVSAGTSRGS